MSTSKAEEDFEKAILSNQGIREKLNTKSGNRKMFSLSKNKV